MEQAGVIHTLAEPNLTAISGETATFVAGGEFPVLNGYSCSPDVRHRRDAATTCQPSIDFKKFGVSLNFTPVVLSEGRISLKVMTEVSDLSSQNSLTIVRARHHAERRPFPRSAPAAPRPRSKFRPAASLAMAGMIQNETKQQHQRPAGPDASFRFSDRCSRATTTSISRPS